MPPQMPNRSSCSSAYSRHSARTSQLRHTRFALPGRSSLFREERLRICLCAQRLILPAQLVLILWTDEDLRQRDDDLSHSASSLPNSEPPVSPLPAKTRITPMK